MFSSYLALDINGSEMHVITPNDFSFICRVEKWFVAHRTIAHAEHIPSSSADMANEARPLRGKYWLCPITSLPSTFPESTSYYHAPPIRQTKYYSFSHTLTSQSAQLCYSSDAFLSHHLMPKFSVLCNFSDRIPKSFQRALPLPEAFIFRFANHNS